MSERTVAVLGASADRRKFGNKAVRAYGAQGWRVFPVNPREEQIEGLTVYTGLAAIPEKLNRISVYLPVHVTLGLVDEIARANADEVWLNPGAESDELVAALKAEGVAPIVACSIVGIGMDPDAME